MEAIGKVNCYHPYPSGKPTSARRFVINLSNGTTPFLHVWNGEEYASNFYRLTVGPALTITYAHYRPTREEFETLDPATQEHVLNGGLLCATLDKARPIAGDPVETTWSYEQFQQWGLATYGRRLPPQPPRNK